MLDTVNLIGLGGIGSAVAKTIVKIGCERIFLFDDDTVEAHNLHNQNYGRSDVGMPKALALARRLEEILPEGRQTEIIPRQERVGEHSYLTGIVIVAVDSAKARREIFSACRYNAFIPLYIEAGAAQERGAVTVFIPHDTDHVTVYRTILKAYSDE